MAHNAGDKCSCCRSERLFTVRGVVVCPQCDSVRLWPNVKRGGQ